MEFCPEVANDGFLAPRLDYLAGVFKMVISSASGSSKGKYARRSFATISYGVAFGFSALRRLRVRSTLSL